MADIKNIPLVNDTWARLGSAAGQGLQQGLQGYATNKMQQLQQQQTLQLQEAERRRTQQEIKGAFPFLSDQQAALVSAAPPKERYQFLSQLGAAGAPQQPQGMDALGSGEANILSAGQGFGQPMQPRQGQELTPEEFARYLQNPATRRAEQDIELKAAAEQRKGSEAAREFSAPYQEKATASKDNIRDYDQLIELAKSGNLRAGNPVILMSKFGIEDISRNLETQLADKLIARLAQNSRSAFGPGTRVTNYLERTFQRSLPSLYNTPEAIGQIAKLNKLADQANIIKDDVRKELLAKNKGVIPFDLADQIEEKAAPKLEELQKKALKIAQRIDEKAPKVGQRSASLGNPADFPMGTIRVNRVTGKSFETDGKEWKEVSSAGGI